MQNYIIYFFLAIFFFFSFYFAFIWSRKSIKISNEKIKYFQKQLKKISTHISSKEKIIDADKLYHKILVEKGYNGTFGDILKQKPLVIKNLNKIWELHKLRNNLAHDFDNHDEIFLNEKSKDFLEEIGILLKKVS